MLNLNARNLRQDGEPVGHAPRLSRRQACQAEAILECIGEARLFISGDGFAQPGSDVEGFKRGQGDDVVELASQLGSHQVVGFGKEGARVQVSSP